MLYLSEDSWRGDALFTVTVNGHSLGPAQSVTASHASHATQAFTFSGFWGTGPVTVGVSFINDKYGGTQSTDRNLYVDFLVYNGQTYADLSSTSTAKFTVG